jgi:hypothetical protein
LAKHHSGGGIFHSFAARFNARTKSVRALAVVQVLSPYVARVVVANPAGGDCQEFGVKDRASKKSTCSRIIATRPHGRAGSR